MTVPGDVENLNDGAAAAAATAGTSNAFRRVVRTLRARLTVDPE